MSGAASEPGLSRLRDLSFAQGVNKPTARLASHVNDQAFFPRLPNKKGRRTPDRRLRERPRKC